MQRLNLPENKALRMTIFASAAVLLLVLIMLFSASGEDEAPPELPAASHPVEQAPPPAPPNTDNSKIILELFNPSAESLDAQRTTTSVQQQIEQTLTISYVLAKCLTISQDDYRDTYRALVLYAQRMKLAPDETSADAVVREIAQSANASYALIYSRTSCADPQLPILTKQLLEWTTAMFNQP